MMMMMMMQVCEAFSTPFWHAAAWVISEKIIHGHLKVHKMFKVETSSLHYYKCRDQNPINLYVSRVSSHVTSFGTLLIWRVLTSSCCSKTPIFGYVPSSLDLCFWLRIHGFAYIAGCERLMLVAFLEPQEKICLARLQGMRRRVSLGVFMPVVR